MEAAIKNFVETKKVETLAIIILNSELRNGELFKTAARTFSSLLNENTAKEEDWFRVSRILYKILAYKEYLSSYNLPFQAVMCNEISSTATEDFRIDTVDIDGRTYQFCIAFIIDNDMAV